MAKVDGIGPTPFCHLFGQFVAEAPDFIEQPGGLVQSKTEMVGTSRWKTIYDFFKSKTNPFPLGISICEGYTVQINSMNL